MENYNTPEAVALRANQEDPIVMYLIVRESLNMGIGKTAAQCAHASQMLQLKFQQAELVECYDWSPKPEHMRLYSDWLARSFRKVVLKADDKEWEKIKLEFDNKHVLVIDAGLTEVEPGSETVIGLFPMYKSQAPKIIKRLQVLK